MLLWRQRNLPGEYRPIAMVRFISRDVVPHGATTRTIAVCVIVNGTGAVAEPLVIFVHTSELPRRSVMICSGVRPVIVRTSGEPYAIERSCEVAAAENGSGKNVPPLATMLLRTVSMEQILMLYLGRGSPDN